MTSVTDNLEAGDSAPPPKEKRKKPRESTSSLWGMVVKIVLLGILDAIALMALFIMIEQGLWAASIITIFVTGIINWIFLGRNKRLSAKYLAPGVFFLVAFQIFVIIYSFFIAFTNFSDGHNSTKEDAISAIERAGTRRVPDSPSYSVTIGERDGDLYLIAKMPDGTFAYGTTHKPLRALAGVTVSSGSVTQAPGFRLLTLNEVLQHQTAIANLQVPLSEDPLEGFLSTFDSTTAFVFTADYFYDAEADRFVSSDGTSYIDGGEGAFVSTDGTKTLSPGWRIFVGFENFARAVTDPQLSGPLLKVTLWTFVFAFLVVFFQFTIGLFLALTLNKHIRGRAFYRIILILPYAFPGFLASLVWAGLLNPSFGFINQVLFGGANIQWLNDPWLARFSLVMTTVWIGYGYMFLVSTGALQSLPEDVVEAAKVDGASPWRIFRSIKLPLLLIPLAPLLISSFAFNFNNFNAVYMLTRGGPQFQGTTMDIGATDILISMVYKVAFGTSTRDFGLASALSIVIFIVVGLISLIMFRRTKTLEEG